MEAIYRIFMYIFPYAIAIALYVWMWRKAIRVPNKILKAVALIIIGGGFAYTLYSIATTAGALFTDDSFHFQILIITIIVLFLASIAMAFGEPES